MSRAKLFATLDPGLEHVALEELRELAPVENPRVAPGRLYFEAELGALPRIVMWWRTLNRLHLVLWEGEVRGLHDIYRVVKEETPVEQYLEPGMSFAIRASRSGEHSFTSIDVARAAGQGVIDRFLSAGLPRPRVNLEEPDLEIFCELRDERLVVSINLVGESMHKRWYRVYNHVAALKTTIAAAMLRLAGFRPQDKLLDPMCGGGTIAAEAGLVRKGIPVTFYGRHHTLAMRRIRVLEHLWRRVVEETERVRRSVVGSPGQRLSVCMDIAPKHLEGAIANARSAGVDDTILFTVGDAKRIGRFVKEAPNTVVTNPPYGHRMHRHRLDELYHGFLSSLAEVGSGIRVVFITSAIETAERAIENSDVELIERIYVMHGTLPSYIYVLRT